MRLAILGLLMMTLFPAVAVAQEAPVPPEPPVQQCVNLGNTLESPREGEWGLTAQEAYFTVMADSGFDTVRIPTRWSAHAEAEPPYTIDDAFFARMDEVIGWALDADLQVILNIHHFEDMMTAPEANRERLLALWSQIAEHYADYPDSLLFEALNEPNNQLGATLWNDIQAEVLAVIRESNPERWVIIGGENWNGLDSLERIELPDDERVMATFHFYEPFEFTHQGAEWVDDMDAYLGRLWGTESDKLYIATRLFQAARWADEHEVPVLMGEFGAYSRADHESRIQWTQNVRENAEQQGIGWCYWEFGAGFGIYDRGLRRMNDLYPALIPGQ